MSNSLEKTHKGGVNLPRDLSFLATAGINEISLALAHKRLSICQMVTYFLERIASVDQAGPCINSVLEVNPDAMHIAEALEAEYRTQGPRSLLHGIPVLLKDNIDTADKLHTSAGSLALTDSYAPEDSYVAAKLRQAGAIILGKANMTEWANFMTNNMPNGFSSRGGQVLNPYGPGKFDVGGSSSGSGAAVAAGLCQVAVGTETSGSILSPASANSIVGIKPTVGLISRYGVIPISHSQDTAGPMARTVADAAALLSVLVGCDERDPATLTSKGRHFNDYTQFLQSSSLQGARIGIPRDYYRWLGDDRMPVIEEAIGALQQAGATIVDPVEIPSAKEKSDHTVLVYEFKPNLNAYLQRLKSHVPVHSLQDVVEFNARDPERTLKHGQTLLIASQEKSGRLTEPEYLQARLRDLRNSREEGIDYVMEQHSLDALLFVNNFGAGIAAKAGYPSITVPAGYTAEGLPVGATFTARAYEEPKLISLAYAFEQVTQSRRPPVFS